MTSGILLNFNRTDAHSVDCEILYRFFLNELDSQTTMIRSSLNEIQW